MLKHFLISIIVSLVCVNIYSQTGSLNVRKVLSKIKSVPTWYSSNYLSQSEKIYPTVDSAYKEIVRLDTNAIIKLMDFLPDTSRTKIKNPCGESFLTFGQLAFFLINDIENIPLSITNLQWDTFGDCGPIPNLFLEYLKNNGQAFENQYRAYFNSNNRQANIKGLKRIKKYGS